MWCVWALVNDSVRNSRTKPPTNPAIAVSPARSKPSGKRSTKASASSIPAAKAADRDRPLAPNSPPSKASRLAPVKPTAASTDMRIALTPAPQDRLAGPLAALGARPVYLQTVGVDPKITRGDGKPAQVQRALLELRDLPAPLADEVMVMVLRELVARTSAQIQPPHQSQPREEPQRPVHRDHPHPGTPGPYALETLVLLRRNSLQYRQTLRRGLVPAGAHPPCNRLEPHVPPLLIEIFFHLHHSKGYGSGQRARTPGIMEGGPFSAKS